MTPARRQKLEAGLAIIRAVNDADAWDTRTAETREALISAGASFIDGNTNTIRLGGVTASCTYDKGEHLLLRWAANARKALAEADPDAATGCADDRSALGQAIGSNFASEEEE